MKNCKKCGKKFHYCRSCDYDEYNHAGYCSRTCYESTEEFYILQRNLKRLYDSLTVDQKTELWSLWDNGVFEDDKLFDVCEEIIKCPETD